MSPISLNLVALTVFAFTLSALLGPLLHLSPAVPALAVVLILGLGTADRLWLSGQGGNLLLALLPGSPERDQRVLAHEAGHFLVAHLLGIPVQAYSLSPWQAIRRGLPGQGGVQFDRSELETQIQAGRLTAGLLDRYSTVWMAGVAAEQQIWGSAEGGGDDRQQLRLALAQLRRGAGERLDPAFHERWALLRAKTLLQDHAEAHRALMAQMQAQAPVAECCAAIEAHRKAAVGEGLAVG